MTGKRRLCFSTDAAVYFPHPVANDIRGQTRFFDAHAMKMRFPEVLKILLACRQTERSVLPVNKE